MSCALDTMTSEKIVDAIENKEFVWKKEYNEDLVKRFEVAREFLGSKSQYTTHGTFRLY